jgi:uncharacterized membrane protein
MGGTRARSTPAAASQRRVGAAGTQHASWNIVAPRNIPSDRAKRSFAKAATYRIGATLFDLVGVYVVTGKPHVAIGFAFVANICAVVGYYLHERVWARVRWARE